MPPQECEAELRFRARARYGILHPKDPETVARLERLERSDARQNRQRIIDAAHDLFLEHGTGVEMRQVAERAGVGIGTIYRNFPTKADLVVAVATLVIESTESALETVYSLDDPVEAVIRYITTLLETFSRTAPLTVELMSTPVSAELKNRVVCWVVEPRLDAVIERGVRLGAFRPDLDVPVARLFVASAADPLIALAAGGGLPPARLRCGLIELVLRALLSPDYPLPDGPRQKGA
jgi:AcrR family transcriptional regulator